MVWLMQETERLAESFEQHRPRLLMVAYRMLGSMAEADDAVQDTWLRLSRSDAGGIENLGGWLTTVVSRECLHVLRSRRSRREDSFAEHLPDMLLVPDAEPGPEHETVLADAMGPALRVVLDRLNPAERLAFVLHDMFGLPFEEIAGIVDRTPAAARQLASRARRRVNGAQVPPPDPDLARQRRVVEAFHAAARAGDFAELVRILDPDVVLVSDFGPGRPPTVVRGAPAVARSAHGPHGARLHSVVVGGAPAAMITIDGQPFAVLVFTVEGDRIVTIEGVGEPGRVRRIADAVFAEPVAPVPAPAVTSPGGDGSQE
jgi:RNA polymerase sigma-70 factor (ECF subfamily)